MFCRIMTESDVLRVSQIEAECIKHPWSYDSLLDAATNKNALYIVAVHDDEVVGYVGMWISIDEAEITSVAVTESFRRRGVATMLLREAVLMLEPRGVEKIFLEVRMSNEAAKALYTREGFKNIGIRPNFYENPVEDGLLMLLRIVERETDA